MIRSFLHSFELAIGNLRANLFHTFFSVLGIVIGVAALVATLSLIDGLEKTIKEQITTTTSLKAVAIAPKEFKTANGLSVKKDSLQVLDAGHFKRMLAETGKHEHAMLYTNIPPHEITFPGKQEPVAARIEFSSTSPEGDSSLFAGKLIPQSAFDQGEPVALINYSMAELLAGKDSTAGLVGKRFAFMGKSFLIHGIAKPDANGQPAPKIFLPIAHIPAELLRQNPPSALILADEVEHVLPLKAGIQDWLKKEYGEKHISDFEVSTNETRVSQASEGFVLFRIIMGLIVGLSVLVGGVGVMNVLLISVTERTPEVGLRKALGAKKGDILRLFLSESITISIFGCALGLLGGILITLIFIPIVKAFTKIPFQAVYTLNTFMVISIVSILIGILFGTYPAMKAARLDPVDAIRRE